MPEILSIGELLDLGNSASTAGLIPYSALEFNGSGDISGISGSAIAGGVDTTIVSAIASSYVESGISGLQPSGDYVDSSSMSSYVPFSGFEYSAGTQTITAISGSAIGGAGGSEFSGVYTDNTISGSGLSASPLGVVKMDLEFDSASLTRTITGDTAIVSVRYPVYLVSSSADATAQDVVYIVTGSTP